MSIKKYKFVSPGIFLKEIDRSQVPQPAPAVGPVIIGRTERGPAMRPVRVESFEEFTRIFGNPQPGCAGMDVYREGNGYLAPTYASYAAQAYLDAAIPSPVNIVRLMGIKHPKASAAGQTSGSLASSDAGWICKNTWGLFVTSGDEDLADLDGPVELTLGAVIYADHDEFIPFLKGDDLEGAEQALEEYGPGDHGRLIKCDNKRWRIQFSGSSGLSGESIISFDDGENFIRKVLNTNPVLVNPRISAARAGTAENDYFLGETFEDQMQNYVKADSAAILLPLNSPSINPTGNGVYEFGFKNVEARESKTGWIFSQDMGNPGDFDPLRELNGIAPQKLFRICGLAPGDDLAKNYKIAIEDISIKDSNDLDPYSTFSVVLKDTADNNERGNENIEVFSNCNLNPKSPNYIARRIGDVYYDWDSSEERYKYYGNYLNRSDHIRIEMNPDVDDGNTDPTLAPFGFYGPIVPKDQVDPAGGTIGADAASGAESATALIKFNDANAAAGDMRAMLNGHGFTITDHLGTAVSFVFDSSRDANVSRGATVVDEGVNKVVIGIQNVTGEAAVRDEIKAVIDALDGSGMLHDLKVTTSNVVSGIDNEAHLKLTAGVTGFDGNKPNSSDAELALGAAGNPEGSFLTVDSFTGGTPPTSASSKWVCPGSIAVTFSGIPQGAGANGRIFTLKWPSGSLLGQGAWADRENLYFGVSTYELSAGELTQNYSHAHGDHVGLLSSRIGQENGLLPAHGGHKYAYAFSLDDVVCSMEAEGAGNPGPLGPDNVDPVTVSYEPGSRRRAAASSFRSADTSAPRRSFTATSGAIDLTRLDINQFMVPFVGGSDGVNIMEADPFNNHVLQQGGEVKRAENNYAYASVERAILSVKDPEVIECNVLTMPGITETKLTSKLVSVAEARADTLAIIDLPDVYVPASQDRRDSFKQRLGTTAKASAKTLKDRRLNSSYGCTYYPWVKIADTISDAQVWVPPSVVALGVFSYTEERNEVWFAPAGFNRGGLDRGNAGLPVLNVTEHLSSKERDALYEQNINPIAKFPAEGIVIFGQKTLQQSQSALDRINVRRLLIHIKKRVSRIAAELLFDQNVQATWNRFLGQVRPFLDGVKSRMGLTDYKVVLDSTTTTPDLVDRNIMYAKIFLKPARAIEFIAIDFIITNSGASFED